MPIKTKPATPFNGLGTLRVLQQDNDLNWDVQIEIMRSGLNENGWDYRNVGRYASTFRGTPILCAYLPGGRIGDGHNMTECRGMDGKVHYSFTDGTAERIVGMIYDTDDAVWTEERDGEVWAIARGKLWRFYNPELVDKIARQGRMSVSAETNVTKAHREDDREVYSQWYGLGVTILGDGVAPAVPGANIKALEAMQSKFKEMQLRAAAHHHNKPQDDNKGVKTLGSAMSNKPLLKKVQEKFKDYRILNMSENGDHVLMLNSAGLPCTYISKADDHDVVIPERIEFATLSSSFKFSDETELDVDVMGLLSASVEEANNRAEAAETKAANLTAENERLNSQLQAMNEAEDKRRIEECKKAMEAAVNEAKECGVELPDDLCKSTKEAIEGGCYNSKSDKDGNWIGAECVKTELMSKVGELCLQAAKAKKLAEEKHYAWEAGFNGNNAEGDGDFLSGAIARISE